MSKDLPNPDVSIVIPVWGPYAGAPLREALESVRSQDVPARVMIVDNASGGLADVPGADEIVRSPERLTVGAARNLGLERVDTPYVLFWDADDLMLPGTLRLLRSRIAADPGLLAVAASILEGDPAIPHRWPRRWVAPLTTRPRVFALCHSVWGLYPTTGSTMMRTAAVRDAAGFGDGEAGEDWVLGVSLAYRGRIALDPAPGRLYRQHAGSLWRQHNSVSHILGRTAAVRARIRHDPGIPAWAKLLLPAVWLGQVAAVLVARPAARARRAVHRWIGPRRAIRSGRRGS